MTTPEVPPEELPEQPDAVAVPLEADPADAYDQAVEVELDEDERR